MKHFVFLILLALPFGLLPDNRTAKVNRLKEKAQQAIASHNYENAIEAYHQILDTLRYEDENIQFNLAQAYLKNSTNKESKVQFEDLFLSSNKHIQSLSYLQVSTIAFKNKEIPKTLQYLKEALRANPNNDKARYNYELLKKLNDQQNNSEQQQKSDQNIEPSEFAKNLKEKAELLVSENRYDEALQLLQNGLKIDSSVQAYNSFIKRLETVATIDR